MHKFPRLSPSEIEALLVPRSITDQHPWNTNNRALIERNLKRILEKLTRYCNTQSKIEWDHYGSGYASFVDAWFYQPTAAFAPKGPPLRSHTEYRGLVVLFSRLSPYYVFMEGEKSWSDNGTGSSYLPSFDMVDWLKSEAVLWLATQVQGVLDSEGLVRVMREELMEPLPDGIRPPTVLADRGFTQFDALFYWED